jgi:chromosome partitioning protein
MERGAPHLASMIHSGIDARLNALAPFGDSRPAFVPHTALAGVAITRIKSASGWSGYTDDHTQHLQSLIRRWGANLIEPYIPDGTGVSQTLSAGVPVFDWPAAQNVGGRDIDTKYRELVDAIKIRIDAI